MKKLLIGLVIVAGSIVPASIASASTCGGGVAGAFCKVFPPPPLYQHWLQARYSLNRTPIKVRGEGRYQRSWLLYHEKRAGLKDPGRFIY